MVAVLVLLLVGIGVVAVTTELQAGRANKDVSDRLLPALAGVEELQKAHRDQQIAQREYVLSGQRVLLEPYEAAPALIEATQADLRRLLADQPAAVAMLDMVRQAHDEWLARASMPVISLVDAGRSAEAMAIIATGGLNNQLYTVIRERIDDLRSIVQGQVTSATANVTDEQREVVLAVALALALGLLIAGFALVDLRRSVTRPISDLVTSVSAVAGGALDRPVPATGPAEIANIAEAVEHMRLQLASHTRLAVAEERRMTKSQESERIATELRDGVIGRLFATGSSLSSLANRQPDLAKPLLATVYELDEVISRLRQVVFDLNLAADTSQRTIGQLVLDLVDEVERDLGFTPVVNLDGRVDATIESDLANEVIATASEVLSGISPASDPDRPAIRLTVADSTLHLLTEHDNHLELADQDDRLAAIAARANRHGGSCTARRNDLGRTVLDWAVPTGT